MQLLITRSETNSTCGLSNGSIVLLAFGGIPPYQYQWLPTVSNFAISGNVVAGMYSVMITDSYWLHKVFKNIPVVNKGKPASPYFDNDTTICGSLAVITFHPGVFSNYLGQDNSSLPTFKVIKSGHYSVSVTNSDGCKATDSKLVDITANCRDVYFPGSFSPNGDFRNDLFEIIGNIALVSNFSQTIFNRYGEKVFSSNKLYVKWNGMVKGAMPSISAYVWYPTNTFKGIVNRSKFGTVTLIK